MKGLSTATLALAALLATGAASAADIDGTWVGTVGQSEITFEFKAEGAKLTGTLNNAVLPGATPIQDGKVSGKDISFNVVRTLNEAETKVQWTGKIEGDELKLQRGAVAGNELAAVVASRQVMSGSEPAE